jgi:hypothetical protein
MATILIICTHGVLKISITARLNELIELRKPGRSLAPENQPGQS